MWQCRRHYYDVEAYYRLLGLGHTHTRSTHRSATNLVSHEKIKYIVSIRFRCSLSAISGGWWWWCETFRSANRLESENADARMSRWR